MKDQDGRTDAKGQNPFDYWRATIDGREVYFNRLYLTYDWVNDDGYKNLGTWIEQAAKNAAR